ncbi:MAG: VWA domain-containing protein, partial [Planctomycetes bacterium]|nr:VWA domain-containing protein [Planctomycetota bacterium]
MNRFQLTTASLILTALALPATAAQFGPGILRAGEYATVVEFSTDSPIVQNVPVRPPLQSRVIDLAICLDTSGSMDGLIDSAKQRLWSIVNDLALAEPAPELRVALLTYGNDGHDAENGWVRVDSELTGDLDLISQQLFALQTNGGTELVGRVLSVATGKLNWSQDPYALKLAVVAGNESADQDSVVSFRDACAAAIKNGIMVNSIYCGNPADAEAPLWKEVSMRADGHFATIDHQNGTLAIDTPFDEQLVALTGSVNPT